MADGFLSYMVFFFKALFLKTLKFQLRRHFSLRLVDEFSWDKKKKIIHNLCFIIYVVMGLRVALLRFSCVSIFSMSKTLKIKKKWKNIAK